MGALNIKNPEARDLAQRIADLTGDSITLVVIEALRRELVREQAVQERLRGMRSIWEEVAKLQKDYSKTEDEILGYNEYGGFD